MKEIKTELMHVFLQACEYSGANRVLIKEESKEYFDSLDEYEYLCDVMVPVVTEEKKRDMAISAIDKEIADKQVGINRLIEKKSQLLAITHDPDGGLPDPLDVPF